MCHDAFSGWGHNADPITKGRCCDDCNIKVIKARILVLKELHAKGLIR